MTSMPQLSFDISLDQVQRSDTHYWSEFLAAYFNSDQLDKLSHYRPELAQVDLVIQNKSGFAQGKRELLQQVLQEQYAKSGIELEGSAVGHNIQKLLKPNCYTVTTGQQIHVGLGPLYVLYKVLNTLALVKELSKSRPEEEFVPIFWMASEDHDLEEIQDLHLFGNKHRWETSQTGAVGRMNTKGILAVLDEVEKQYRLNEAQQEFLQLAKEAYALNNYADASRHLIHSLFGQRGLVVVDGDHPLLKKEFAAQMTAELKGENYKSLKQGTQALEDSGFEAQIHIRDINLFKLGPQSRERIIEKGGVFYAGEEAVCRLDGLEDYMLENAENLSPNVALRPLYQELILPNLIYVGGPSELKYWHQLKALFDHYSLHMPILYLRTSSVILPKKRLKGLNVNDLHLLYASESEIIDQGHKSMALLREELSAELQSIKADLSSYAERIKLDIKGASLDGKINKLYPKLAEIEQITNQLLDQQAAENPQLKTWLKLKEVYFSELEVQERVKHLLEFAETCFYTMWEESAFGFDNLLKINHLLTKSV